MSSSITNRPGESRGVPRPEPSQSVGDLVRQILAPLASLKLTVGLMIFGVLLVLFGTLAQQTMNEFEAARNCFRTWYTWIELKWFVPKNFFPNFLVEERPTDILNRGWGFFFPGGWTIGGLMALNLLAAHGLRFRVQTRGERLWGGLAVIALGCAATYWVIAAGPDKEGFEAATKLAWADIYQYAIAAMALLTAACGFYLSRWRMLGNWERLAFGILTGLFAAATIFLTYQGDTPLIKPEGIRILWQLTKATGAALLLYTGCWLAFRKRAAVVVIHAGLLLMMSNELVVYALHDENLLHVYEGQTVDYVMSVRQPELTLVDQSRPDEDRVITIPFSRLKKDEILKDDKLPCDIQLVEFHRNSGFDLDHRDNLATAGNGLRFSVESKPPATGASGGEEDMPSAVIRLLDKQTQKPIDTFLLSYWFDSRLAGIVEAPELKLQESQAVSIADRPFTIAMRPKRSFRDYAVTLEDVRKVDYVGTETPRSYESDIVVKDSTGLSRDVNIWMNNPVRFSGETFYQSSYGKHHSKGEYSIFQVVRNEGWMIPYVACMIVVVGLLAQFGSTLIRFLHRLSNPERYPHLSENPTEWSAESDPWPAAQWLVPALVVSIPALILTIWNWPPSPPENVPDLYAAGKLPVAYEGRVKPWDSLARNSLRFISNREHFYDAKDKKQPAMRWLLDTMTQPQLADDYKVFRVEASELLETFGVQQREGFRYSFTELKKGLAKFDRMVKAIRKRGDESRREFEGKAVDLDKHLKLYLSLRTVLRPDPGAKATDEQVADYFNDMANALAEESWLEAAPRALPTPSPKEPWTTGTHQMSHLGMKNVAQNWSLDKPEEIAQRLAKAMPPGELRKRAQPYMLQMVAALLKQNQPNLNREQLMAMVQDRFSKLPDDLRALLVEETQPMVLEEIAGEVQTLLTDKSTKSTPAFAPLAKILTTYRDGQATSFNNAVASYQETLGQIKPKEYDPEKESFETYFNYLAIFNTARWLYLIAFVIVAAGWMGFMKPLNNAGTALILFTLVLHTLGLLGRIYISGRPPVTNLYSSAVFIGWGGVVLGLIFEFMYGRSFGNIIAAVLGHITLAVADSLALDGETFIVMQAVLDTNFWLATHVSCVTLGYTTTYVSGLLGLIYLICGMFTPALTPSTEKTLARMIYGTVCFGLLFSFFGTVLGGLWADDSWGRFWGWDPKENGALIIVLWNAVVLHASWDGWAKERGLALLAIVGNIVTTWSWFGVNQLGIGRHSYGFTRGVVNALVGLVLAHAILAILGSLPSTWWFSNRRRATEAAIKRPPAPPTKRERK